MYSQGPGTGCLQMKLSLKIQTPWSLVIVAHTRVRAPAQAEREGQRGMECFSEQFILLF